MKRLRIPLLFLIWNCSAQAQGPLTPPPGADASIGPVNALTDDGVPQATMKTLHQVEPRTAIPGGASGFVIDQSGAYYLTGNIVVAGGDGVTINANNVTLDLNGFSILSSATPSEGNGVRLGQGLRNVAIRNGNIGSDGLGGAFLGGVFYTVSGFPQAPSNLRVADLSVTASEYGISTNFSVATCHVERCLVTGGSVHGIQAGIVKDCVVEGGPIIARIVKDSSVTTPGTSGIVADVVENCYATSTGTAIQAKCLVNSFGTGGGNHDVISAGVAQNVWAEGGSGSGRGISAVVVSNSQGSRANDANGFSNGGGVEAKIVHSTVGSSAYAVAVEGDIVSASIARASNDQGIRAKIIDLSDGWSGTTTGLGGDIVAFSRAKDNAGNGMSGRTIFGSYAANNGGFGINGSVIGNSYANNSGSTGLMAFGNGVITGSVAVDSAGIGVEAGVVNTVMSHSNNLSGIVSSGTVTNSLSTANTGNGISAANVANSYALGNTVRGIYSALIQGSRADGSGQGGLVSDGGVVLDSITVNNAGVGAEGGVVSSVWAWSNDQGGIFSNGTVQSSLAQDNTGKGFVARNITGSVALGNTDHGISGYVTGGSSRLLAVHSLAAGNTKAGITAEMGSVNGCFANDNIQGGIRLTQDGAVALSTAIDNQLCGIEAGFGVLLSNLAAGNFQSTPIGFLQNNYGGTPANILRAFNNGSNNLPSIGGSYPDK